MSSILLGRITKEVASGIDLGARTKCVQGIEGRVAGWQTQLAITQWTAVHSSQQSSERGLAA